MLTDVFTKVFTTTDDVLKPPYFMRFFELYWGFEPLFPCFASVVKFRFYGIFCVYLKKNPACRILRLRQVAFATLFHSAAV